MENWAAQMCLGVPGNLRNVIFPDTGGWYSQVMVHPIETHPNPRPKTKHRPVRFIWVPVVTPCWATRTATGQPVWGRQL